MSALSSSGPESPAQTETAGPAGSATVAASRTVAVQRWRDGRTSTATDEVAEEVPVALTYQGISHVVMLATPADLEDLAVGFTLSEAIARREEIRSVKAVSGEDGALTVDVGIDAQPFSQLLRRQRNLTGRTGCGLCGAETIEDAIRTPAPVSAHGVSVSADELHSVLRDLKRHQHVNLRTGSVHAAAWAVPGRGIQLVREDVGRHNALDKLIGALVRGSLPIETGFLIVTSRASYEMVQKAATVGAGLLVAISAPTAMAIRLAQATGLTLVGFAREHEHVIYACPHRLV